MAPETTDPSESDTIAILFPVDQETKERNGAHCGKILRADGSKLGFNLKGQIFFQAEELTYDGIDALYSRLTGLARDGKSFITRSAIAHKGAYIRRIKDRRGKCPAGLRRAHLRLLVLDLDGWKNLDGWDPRTDAAGAWSWIIDKLGPEFADVPMVAQWSSSCCFGAPVGEAPATLDGRLYVMMDRPLAERAAIDLLGRIDARVKEYYAGRGVTYPKMLNGHKKMIVDPKVADAIQPIYIADPFCELGVSDPLAGVGRWSLLSGSRGAVDVEALWNSLPSLSQARQATEAATVRAAAPQPAGGEPGMKKSLKAHSAVRIPGQVIPLGPAALEIEAMRRAMAARTPGEWMEGCHNFYLARIALEQAALAVHRGGLAEGVRDEACLRIAACLVAAMPLGRDVEWVRTQVRTLLVRVAGEDWVREEWEGQGADCTVLANYVRASRGEPGRNGWRDPRYAYCKARLLDEWQPSRDEILELRLRSLASDADRQWMEREVARLKENRPVRGTWLLEARLLAPEVHRLRTAGKSVRTIATRLGLTASKVQRLLALSASQVAGVDEWLADLEAQQAADAADLLAASDDEATADAEVNVTELLARGIADVDEIARLTKLSVRLVAEIMDYLGVGVFEDLTGRTDLRLAS